MQAPDDELARIRARKLAELQRLAAQPAAPAALAAPVAVTDASLDTFVAQHPFAVLDCWAAWCGPCRMMEPVIEAMAREHAGEVAFGKLNVDENPASARRFGIASIPAFLVFKNGRLVDQLVGAMPPQAFRAALGLEP